MRSPRQHCEQGCAPSETLSRILPCFWWWNSILGISPVPASVDTWCLCVCFYMSFLSSYSHTSHIGLGVHPNDLSWTWLNPQRPYFQIKSQSQVPGVRTSTSFFFFWWGKGHNSTHKNKSFMSRAPSPLAILQPLPDLTIIYQDLFWQGQYVLQVSCPYRALILSRPMLGFLVTRKVPSPSTVPSITPSASVCLITCNFSLRHSLSANSHYQSLIILSYLHSRRLPAAWLVIIEQFWSGPTSKILCYSVVLTILCSTKLEP